VPGGFTYPDGSSAGTTVENGLVLIKFDAGDDRNALMSVNFTVPTGTTQIELRATLASGTPTFSRVIPGGGDVLTGMWQRIKDTGTTPHWDIGEMTLRNITAPPVPSLRPPSVALTRVLCSSSKR